MYIYESNIVHTGLIEQQDPNIGLAAVTLQLQVLSACDQAGII